MPTLKEIHKTFIVQELACFQSYSEVAAAVKETFGIEIERQQVYSYDPTRNKVAEKWQEIFDATRKKFLEDVSSIPIANKAFRLNELWKIYQSYKTSKTPNTKAMKDTIEQASKESGDHNTNKLKHELTGKDGKELTPRKITVNVVRSNSIIKDEDIKNG